MNNLIFKSSVIKSRLELIDTCNIVVLSWIEMIHSFGIEKVKKAFKKNSYTHNDEEIQFMSILNTQYQAIKLFINRLTDNHRLPKNIYGEDLKLLTVKIHSIIKHQHERVEKESAEFKKEFADVFKAYKDGMNFMNELDFIVGDWE